jgi:hypothetical protein
MKLTWLAIIALMPGCGRPTTPSPDRVPPDAAESTVAFVSRDSDGDAYPFCTGVWASKRLLVTAAHCAQRAARELAGLDENTDRMLDEIGVRVRYVVRSDAPGGPYEEPRWSRIAAVMSVDRRHDLALLTSVDAPPEHPIVRVEERAPAFGDPLYFVGHAHALYWTFEPGHYDGLLERFKVMRSKDGPFVQVSAPVFEGMSGGAAFDRDGRVAGIVSFGSMKNAGVAFLVAPETLRGFLAHNGVR